jgi:signal transduction histidine kinase
MYRILQETLTNVARHARASAVAVTLTRGASTIELVVRDNGVGFEMGRSHDTESGLGLRGMGERVTLLGGSLQIESAPGMGTTVRVRIPTPLLAQKRRGRPRGKASTRPSRT